MPTLVTLREKLLEQPEIEARSLALKLELFTDGSLDAFAHQTNVNTSSRIVSYDIFKLGKQLKTMGLLVITDAMINRVNENWRKVKGHISFLMNFMWFLKMKRVLLSLTRHGDNLEKEMAILLELHRMLNIC